MATLETHLPVRTNAIARRPLLSFFILALAISWILALPAILWDLPFKPFQTAGAYGPLLAGIIVSAAMGGQEMKAFVRRMLRFRFSLLWYGLAIFGYVALYLLVAGLAGGPVLQSLAESWGLVFTLYLPALLTTYLVNAIGEEAGWTSFALHHLQKQFRPWLAAVILGVVWAVWHLPAYFVPSEMGAFNPVGFVIFVLQAIFVRMIWTWATNHTRGSGVMGTLLHSSGNAVSLALIPRLLPAPSPEQLAVSGLILLGLLFVSAVLIAVFTRGRLGR